MPNRPFKVFIVEDDAWYHKLLVHTISLNPEVEAEGFFTSEELLKNLNRLPDLVTVDYRLPDMTGDELIRKIRDFNENIKIIVISE